MADRYPKSTENLRTAKWEWRIAKDGRWNEF